MAAARVRSGGRPTLEEVAARAGVGRGTASRVINGSPWSATATREAVEAAVAELAIRTQPCRPRPGGQSHRRHRAGGARAGRPASSPNRTLRHGARRRGRTGRHRDAVAPHPRRQRPRAPPPRPVPHRPPRRRSPPGRRARRRPAAGTPGAAGHAVRDQRRPARGRDAALGRLRQLRGCAGRRRAPRRPGTPPGGHDHRPPGGVRGPAPSGRLPRGGRRRRLWPRTSASSPPADFTGRAARRPCATSWPAAPTWTRSSSPPT